MFLDYETRSSVDLRKHGGRRYAVGSDTSLLCGVAFDPAAGHLWVWSPFGPMCECCDAGLGGFSHSVTKSATPPADLVQRLDSGEPVIGHNAWQFDALLFGGQRWNWVDSLPRVRRLGLPGGLDRLGAELYGVPKDPDGQRVLKMSMAPGRKGFVDPDSHRLTHLVRYCARDVVVLAQAWADLGLGEPHVDDPVLEVHHAINERGIRVDVGAARRIADAEVELTEQAVARSPVDLKTLRSPAALCKWLKKQGVKLSGFAVTDVTEPTVRRLLAVDWPNEEVTRALEARLRVATVTGGKIRALLDRVCDDGRLRDTTLYWGAHTGRWTGKGFQVHNLPRAERPPADAWDPEAPLVKVDLDDTAQQLQAMLRGVLVGDPHLVISDLAQIEYRVLRWCVGDDEALASIASGVDPYQLTADRMGVSRQEGKVVELAAGYGGGRGSLDTWAATYGCRIDDHQAAIESWRDANPLIAGKRKGFQTWVNPEDPDHVVAVRKGGFWRHTQRAAWDAVAFGVEAKVGRVFWRMEGDDLLAELPSGRALRYRNAALELWDSRWSSEPKKTLAFDSVRAGREATYGGRLVENVVQAIARDVIAYHLVELERAGLRPVMHVHDEIVCETDDVSQVERIMSTAPHWAVGLPVACEAKLVERYEK